MLSDTDKAVAEYELRLRTFPQEDYLVRVSLPFVSQDL